MAVAWLLVPLALELGAVRPPGVRSLHASAWRSAHILSNAAAIDEQPPIPVTSDGGVQKRVLQQAEEGATMPLTGALVRVIYTCAYLNGTILDTIHASEPREFQLGTGDVVEGLNRAVRTMRVGERASITCTPRWMQGIVNVDKRVPTNTSLLYDVELLSWKEGPPLDSDDEDFDMHTYKTSLEGKAAASGRTDRYAWSESGGEVTLWLPLDDDALARDIRCDFSKRLLQVWISEETLPRLSGELKGRANAEDSYWVIDDYEGARHLQIVLAKAGAFTCWDGVFIYEPFS
ncbi:MAG: hypothetical protein SGPRY_002927 [Prymnesium sp.]